MGAASRFLRDMFAARSTAPVCVVSLANIRGELPPVELYTRDLSEVEAFLKRYDKPGRAVYFGVNTVLDGKTRSKENVAEITALHADLDFKGIVEDRKEIEAVLARLPLLASVIVCSGNGLHPYWWTSASPGEKERVETALRRLAWALAGDPAVCEVARVMRLPGSHNSKDGAWKPVEVVARNDATYELEQLEGWLAGLSEPLLRRKAAVKGNGPLLNDPYAFVGSEQIIKERLDIDAMWNELQYLGEGRGGNLHDTEIKIGAALLSRGEPVENVVAYLREQLGYRVPESLSWDWSDHGNRSELRIIRRDCISWLVKHPELLDKQEEKPTWLTRNRRIKELLKQPKVQLKTEAKLPALNAIFAEDLEKHEVKPRDWIVDDFILAYQLNGLFGDGGVGKDMILLQLAIAMTTGRQWLGKDVKQGNVLYFPVEDDLEELRRRQYAINKHYDVQAADYPHRFKIVPMIGEDTVLAVFNSRIGKIEPTLLYQSVCNLIAEFRPLLTIVGNRVNIFSVNQNEDAHARQCLGLLTSLCVKYRTTVIMPGHASLRGLQSGDGTSGSVQWSNGVRMRTFLRRPKEEDEGDKPDTNQRELEVMKVNYAPTGTVISMWWTPISDSSKLGLFTIPFSMQEGKQRTQEQDDIRANDDFIRLMQWFTKNNINVSADDSSKNNAPTLFSRHETALHKGKSGRAIYRRAMFRLLDAGGIQNEEFGPTSKRRSRLILVGLRVVK
jgi:RecA-family ATPase